MADLLGDLLSSVVESPNITAKDLQRYSTEADDLEAGGLRIRLDATEREGISAALFAVHGLCVNHPVNQTYFGRIHGLCKAVAMAMVTLSEDSNVQLYGCMALSQLSFIQDNCVTLARGGACEAVLSALRLWPSNKHVVQHACMAIQGLTWSNADCRKRFAFLKAKSTLEVVRQTNSAIEVPRWTAEAEAKIPPR